MSIQSRPSRNGHPPAYLNDYVPTVTTSSEESNTGVTNTSKRGSTSSNFQQRLSEIRDKMDNVTVPEVHDGTKIVGHESEQDPSRNDLGVCPPLLQSTPTPVPQWNTQHQQDITQALNKIQVPPSDHNILELQVPQTSYLQNNPTISMQSDQTSPQLLNHPLSFQANKTFRPQTDEAQLNRMPPPQPHQSITLQGDDTRLNMTPTSQNIELLLQNHSTKVPQSHLMYSENTRGNTTPTAIHHMQPKIIAIDVQSSSASTNNQSLQHKNHLEAPGLPEIGSSYPHDESTERTQHFRQPQCKETPVNNQGPYGGQWNYPPPQWQQYFQASSNVLTQEIINFLRTEIASHYTPLKKEISQMRKQLNRLSDLFERELSSEFPMQPDLLPISTADEVRGFEEISEEEYKNIVRYLGSLGGHTLQDTSNEIMKSAVKDSVSQFLTWCGREKGTITLGKTRLAKAMYASAAKNRNYPKPDWVSFADAMSNVLRSAKQRHRNTLTRSTALGAAEETNEALTGSHQNRVFPRLRRQSQDSLSELDNIEEASNSNSESAVRRDRSRHRVGRSHIESDVSE